nr:pentapeptide repeat-containing protein [Crocosphaera sp.]
RRLKECRQKQQSLTLSTLALGFLDNSAKHQLRSRVQAVGLFLIIPLIGTIIGLPWLFKEIQRESQLNADKRLLQNCPEKQQHCPGRREALERLVKAGKSLAYLEFDNAYLYSVNLNYANLYDVNLRYTYLRYAEFYNANLNYAYLNHANLNYAYLNYAYLNYAYLEYANLSYANLNHAYFYNANLRYANLRYANLKDARSSPFKVLILLPYFGLKF